MRQYDCVRQRVTHLHADLTFDALGMVALHRHQHDKMYPSMASISQ
jgi:hypothetical protein